VEEVFAGGEVGEEVAAFGVGGGGGLGQFGEGVLAGFEEGDLNAGEAFAGVVTAIEVGV
jgi:hypothetical protein